MKELQFEPFNSRSIWCRNPQGAVTDGTTIHFVVTMPRDMRVSGVRLVVSGDGESVRDLYWTGTDNTLEWWDCDYTPASPGLYFYHFEYSTPWGVSLVMQDRSGAGIFTSSGSEWQITVYDRNFRTSDFVKGGVIYQIFPDRFCYSGEEKKNVPGDRILRGDRDALPAWRPDPDGEIRNNDYFRGDFRGIESKLPYLKELGVTCLYLNPVCEAHSNHRYDTADYMKPDPLLGTESDFAELCSEARALGIRVIVDGVFSHTGADSVYFNKNGRYGNGGAYNDENSPYRKWYSFRDDGSYESWWDFETLPEVRENEPSYTEFITGENGVISKWMSLGADGYRLDVADELPDEFIENVRKAVKRENPDGYLLGEVWEDASNKISFGHRRRYLLGSQLDSVMNYPFMEAIIKFVTGGKAEDFMETVVTVCENYPKPSLDTLMNHIGTHDTARILNALAGCAGNGLSREEQSKIRLTGEKYEKAKTLLKAAATLQFTLPGVPSVYYGDEAGLTGAKDPFNRRCFPWDSIDTELRDHYVRLGEMRKNPVFRDGVFVPVSAMLGVVCYLRKNENGAVAVVSNMNPHPVDYDIPGYPGGKRIHTDSFETVVTEI